MKMIRPRRSRSMPFAARLARRKDPVRLVSITDDQSSSDIRRTSVSAVMPALATSTSTGPCAASISAKAASTAAGSVMSQRTSSVPSGAPPLRVVTATRSPLATKASAMARPMPRLPPVTRTDRPTGSVFASLTVPDASDYPGVALKHLSGPRVAASLVLEAEADLEADLEVLDSAVLDLSPDLGDLEPVDVAQRLAGPLDGVADRLVDPVGRGADDLADAVGAVGHGGLRSRRGLPSLPTYDGGMGRDATGHRNEPIRITTAASSRAEDIAARQKRYLLSMGIRSACFVGAVVAGIAGVDWLWPWLIAAALILPYVAVVMANNSASKSDGFELVDRGYGRPELPAGAKFDQPTGQDHI